MNQLLGNRYAKLEAISSHFPANIEENGSLALSDPSWDVHQVIEKIGVARRFIADESTFTSDLAVGAGRKLMQVHDLEASAIDYLILVTQTPDFLLPSTSALVHLELGLGDECGVFDLNQGCSGYVQGLGVAKGLIESGQASNILLITADTYSKLVHPGDKSLRPIFGDAATASWISNRGTHQMISPVMVGADGSGAGKLVCHGGGMRLGSQIFPQSAPEARGLEPSDFDLYMDGRAIFNFTLDVSEKLLNRVLSSANLNLDDIDLFVFHQANKFMVSHLTRKLQLDQHKVPIDIWETGNTVSSSIPLIVESLLKKQELPCGSRLLLYGYGVGLSWAGTVMEL